MMTSAKRLMYVVRRAPYGSIYGLEALDVMLAGGAFDQKVCAVFLDDGVYQLKQGQNPSVFGMKHYTKGFRALRDFGITSIYVDKSSLQERGIEVRDLMEIPDDDDQNAVKVVTSKEITTLMEQQDTILQF